MNIRTGTPPKKGVYVCYIDNEIKIKYFKKQLLFWYDSDWINLGSDQIFRGDVHCWIGPLPSPITDEIKEDPIYVYIISSDKTKSGGTHGPFSNIAEATDVIGDEGDYIFKVESISGKRISVCKWNDKKAVWMNKKIK